MGTTAARSRPSAVSRCRPLPEGQADGLIRLSGRIPAGGDTQSIIMSPGHSKPRGPRSGWLPLAPPPAATADHPPQKGHQPEPLTRHPAHQGSPPPAAWNDPLPVGRPKGACGAATRAKAAKLRGRRKITRSFLECGMLMWYERR